MPVWVGKVPVNPNEEQPNMDIMLGQAFYNHMLLVDPADPSRNTVYIGGQLALQSQRMAAPRGVSSRTGWHSFGLP